jgi:starvation-inducible DNA-binding protein
METAETIQEGEAQASRSHLQQREIGRELQATLVELVDLALLGKQLQWSVVGPGFRPLHLQLDELVTAWRELADTLVELAVALGYWPDGQAGTVAETTELDPVSPEAQADREVVQLLTSRLVEVVGRARARMDRLGPLDLASQDVLIEVVRALEQQLWMVRAQRAL